MAVSEIEKSGDIKGDGDGSDGETSFVGYVFDQVLAQALRKHQAISGEVPKRVIGLAKRVFDEENLPMRVGNKGFLSDSNAI